MIAYLKGVVLEKETGSVVLDVQGVGYRVSVLSTWLDNIVSGEAVSLKIHHHVSSDTQALYGFATAKDRRYFKLLLTVPSVGPRTAMGILEAAEPDVLEQAVASGESKILTQVSGVGGKTAERILVELKGKLSEPAETGVAGGVAHETVDALISIGFTLQQARSAVQGLSKSVTTVEEAVREVLQKV